MAAEALAASGDPDPSRLGLLAPRAVSFYLAEREEGRTEWSYPSFVIASHNGFEAAYELAMEEELWAEFQAEAERQDVDPQRLLHHAAFYYAAARDEGRLTERIAAELRRETEAGGE
ncbi:MAG: hypothetical protein ACTHKT_03980 [Solirubrobacterales bacterium]